MSELDQFGAPVIVGASDETDEELKERVKERIDSMKDMGWNRPRVERVVKLGELERFVAERAKEVYGLAELPNVEAVPSGGSCVEITITMPLTATIITRLSE